MSLYLDENHMRQYSYSAAFNLASAGKTRRLGQAFAEVLRLKNRDVEDMPTLRIGMDAPSGTGKTTFVRGLLDQFPDRKVLESRYGLNGSLKLRRHALFKSSEFGKLCHDDRRLGTIGGYLPCFYNKSGPLGDKAVGTEIIENADTYNEKPYNFLIAFALDHINLPVFLPRPASHLLNQINPVIFKKRHVAILYNEKEKNMPGLQLFFEKAAALGVEEHTVHPLWTNGCKIDDQSQIIWQFGRGATMPVFKNAVS